MKYYSELLDEMFDSEEELNKAESEKVKPEGEWEPSEEEINEKPEKKDDLKKEMTSKKELADAVEKSDEALKEAYALYDVAKERVQKLSSDYLREVDSIMKEAKSRVEEAEINKYNAIKDFNDKYGVYKTSYTGAKAAEEYNRVLKSLAERRSWIKSIFDFIPHF